MPDFVQKPLFDVDSPWRPPDPSSLPEWPAGGRVAVDVETKDPQLLTLGPGVRRDGKVVGVSFAIEDGPSFYLPVAHASGDNLDPDVAWRYLKDQATGFSGTVVGANLSYDLDYLAEAGVRFPSAAWFRDVLVAEPLLDELKEGYSLEAVLGRHGLPGKDEGHLRSAAATWGLDPKKDLWKLPARHVGAYAEGDVRMPLLLLRRQEKKIEAQKLCAIWDLESRLVPVLVAMRRRGVRVDFDRLAQVESWAEGEELRALGEVRERSGKALTPADVWKAQAVADLVRSLGYEPPPTATGKPRTERKYLESLNHPAITAFVKARKFNKLRTTFAVSLRRYAVDGRIHCSFNQMLAQGDDGDRKGARYGRMSAVDPNLQQQPNPEKDPEVSGMWRQVFVPDEGGMWACLDFSSQEPRMIAHFASAAKCSGGEEIAAKYRENPDLDFHAETAKMTGLPRKAAKIIFLGLAYGMGGGKLCRSLGLPTRPAQFSNGRAFEAAGPEGEALLARFHAMVPFMKELSNRCDRAARNRGYIRTLLGRKCRFPMVAGRYEWTHKALNRLIQGSSADQTKRCLVDLDAAGFPLQLQVHDEVDLTVAGLPEARRAADLMEAAVALSVPSKVDVAVGPSWGEAT
jgi:Mesyanzhinovviridae DNA polymerase